MTSAPTIASGRSCKRVGQAFEEHLGRRLAVSDRLAEIAAQQAPEEQIELLVDGPIEAERVQEVRAVFLGGVLTQEEVGGISAHARQREDDQRQHEQEHHALREPPEDESLHGTFRLRARVSLPGAACARSRRRTRGAPGSA